MSGRVPLRQVALLYFCDD